MKIRITFWMTIRMTFRVKLKMSLFWLSETQDGNQDDNKDKLTW